MLARWIAIELLTTAAAVMVLAVAWDLDPDVGRDGAHVQLGLPPCHYQKATGMPCLSCGMTTAFAQAAHLRFGDAARANAAGLALFVLVLAVPPWMAHAALTRRDPLRFLHHRIGRWVLPAAALLALFLWMLRLAAGWY